MITMRVAIVGGSGYAGGELMRLLLKHPNAEIKYVTSRKLTGKPVSIVNPNLDGLTNLKYVMPNLDVITKDVDVVFLATPHGESQNLVPTLLQKGVRIIDLSADFRLKNMKFHEYFYGPHACPQFCKDAVYGMPELNKDKIKDAKIIAVPGCHASSAIYGLLPVTRAGLIKPFPIVVDSKTGSTGAGSSPSEADHHPVRANVVRPYGLTGHRHTAEIEESILPNFQGAEQAELKVSFSAHAVDMVRGILSTIHVFLKEKLEDEKPIYKAFREFIKDNPFLRLVKKQAGVFRLPDPKTIIGTNYCDIGFEVDPLSNRLVIVTALDNLVKGAAGNAVQCFNIIQGLPETIGLDQAGIFPI
jgi:LysW-gamma-L-alpha-aminoadipyl-6-phosphate/LysW-L-glutamyl-5-phosphate reductase